MISICKRFEFDAAHNLPKYIGLCRNLHGHRYVLDVEITGPLSLKDESGHGMIMDFGYLKEIVKQVILDRVDHSNLNETCPVYPTAELMVQWIAMELLYALEETGRKLLRVRLYETPTAYAEWRAK